MKEKKGLGGVAPRTGKSTLCKLLWVGEEGCGHGGGPSSVVVKGDVLEGSPEEQGRTSDF